MNSLGRMLAGLAFGLLTACGADTAQNQPPQRWQNLDVQIESRPNPPRAGMNEFLVMVNDSRGRPAHDLVVSLRSGDADPWKQAIQDGQVGVYRTAVKIEPGANPVLQVQLQGKDAEGVLRFPLPQPR